MADGRRRRARVVSERQVLLTALTSEHEPHPQRFAHGRVPIAPPVLPSAECAGVWSPAGGWWADPVHWRRNTALAFLCVSHTGFHASCNWFVLITCCGQPS